MAKPKIEEIPWDIILPEVIKAFTPFIQGITWLAISRFDNRADALSKLIAVTEPIPTVDLNLPSGIVLGSLYHSLEEVMIHWPEIPEPVKEFFETEVQKPKEDETWISFLERRLRETGLFKA